MTAAEAALAAEVERLHEELMALRQRAEGAEQERTESLDQQSAMATVLSAVARAGSDPEPVLFDIAEQAARLPDGDSGNLTLFESNGTSRHFLAYAHPFTPADLSGHQTFIEVSPNRVRLTGAMHRSDLAQSRTLIAEMLRTGRPAQVWGTHGELLARYPDTRIGEGWQEQSRLAIPLLVNGEVIGYLIVARRVVQPFTDQQIALLQAFADQAVIAVENARLLNELQESLAQQTATASILGSISDSPGNQDVALAAVTEAALRLCHADLARVWLRDGDELVAGPHSSSWADPADMPAGSRIRLDPNRPGGQAVLECRPVQVDDLAPYMEEHGADPERVKHLRATNQRSVLLVPLLRGNTAIGNLSLVRTEVRPFSEREVALAEGFADQAVIAIENARLFTELQESLAQQTATADVLGIISGSPGDQEAALGAITEAAFRLCHADAARVWLREGDDLVGGPVPSTQELFGFFGSGVRIAIDPGLPRWQAVLEKRTVQIDDLLRYREEQGASAEQLELLRSITARAHLAVPLLRGDTAIGVLTITRGEVRAFSEREVALAEGFADQAVIVIENARLFEEIRQKSRELEALNQQLAEANQHKSAFVANMSHELRTPLNAIIGYSEMLAEEAEEEGATSFVSDLGKINSSGKHLLSLINNILDLSKIEAGRMDLYLEDFAVQDVLTEVEAVARPLVEQKRNQFLLNVAGEPGGIHADLTKVKQCLLNLLSNAAKFTNDGTVRLAVERSSDADGDWLTFAVADTGIGMTEEQQGRLFQAFSQAEASTSSKYGGTGLGLSLSRSFAQLMGGEISVTSEPGRGSTFTLRLPAVAPEPEAHLPG